jgi:hypothetical protein
MQHSEIGKESEKERFHRIEDKIRELLCVDKLEMEILPNNDIILTINGPTGSRLPLEHHGTGIHELVIICSTLMLYENHIVCIEEPEIHLHPELLRRFYRFLATTNNIYFIATHSNVLLDADETSVVYHVSHDGLSSKITRSYTNDNTRGILRDLGYRASDLLQTNGIIWVEGPSDRIYINKWLALYGCTTLIEGVDYSIMFYGGACLANLSASDCIPSEDFIELLRINSNAIVVIDRDGESADSVLKEYKRRIQSEIGEDNCWITQGREIENYLTPNLLNRYLGSRYPDKSISVEFGIDDKISKCIKTAVGEESFDYAHSKRNYAKEICEMMNSEDLEQLDLKKRIKQICDAITEWNKD